MSQEGDNGHSLQEKMSAAAGLLSSEESMSISFDRAVEYYDQTQGFPLGVQERIGKSLLDVAEATLSSRILEMGIGTGRIAWPIICKGHSYTGIDLSKRMMDRLRAKLSTLPGAAERVNLVQGDITKMPFADGSFDIVLTVQVFHLVADRRQAITEGIRVLKRSGVALNGREEIVNDPSDELASVWCETVRRLGWPLTSRQERAAAQSVIEEWRQLGGNVEQIVAVEYQEPWTPASFIEGLMHRYTSSTWSVPDDIYTEALARLQIWANHHYGPDLITAPIPRHHRFLIELVRFT